MRLPFRDPNDGRNFGQTRCLAVARLLQLEKRFARQPELKKEYARVIDEYLSLRHMIKSERTEQETAVVKDGQQFYQSTYLPHHAVIKESSTSTKVRVVFDASIRSNKGRSLNESLLTGPTIQDDLVSISLRWRQHRIAFTADIQKMYRQIMVDNDDTDYQRIVWRNESHMPIVDYNLLTVTSSAPYMAIKTLQRLATDEKTPYPIGAEATLNDFYVDDILTGADTITDAVIKQKEIRNLLNTGGFDLKKWPSNRIELLEHLPEGYVETDLPLNFDKKVGVKTLGVK